MFLGSSTKTPKEFLLPAFKSASLEFVFVQRFVIPIGKNSVKIRKKLFIKRQKRKCVNLERKEIKFTSINSAAVYHENQCFQKDH